MGDADGGAEANVKDAQKSTAEACFGGMHKFFQDGHSYAVTMDQMNQIHTKLRETRTLGVFIFFQLATPNKLLLPSAHYKLPEEAPKFATILRSLYSSGAKVSSDIVKQLTECTAAVKNLKETMKKTMPNPESNKRELGGTKKKG
jgi:hypothetical protein